MPAKNGIATHITESKAFVDGGKVLVNLADAPKGRRIRQIMIFGDINVVVGTTLAADITCEELQRLIDSVRIGKRIRATGLMLSHLDWQMNGKDVQRPAKIASGQTAGTVNRKVVCVIPFTDFNSISPDDTAPNTEFFTDTPIELGFGSKALFAQAANVTSVNGTFRIVVFHDAADRSVVPTPVIINYDDWAQKTMFLPPGAYVNLFVYKENGATITDTEISDLGLWIDGEKVYDGIKASELTAFFNYYASKGVTQQADGVGGEALELATPFSFLPVLFQNDKYKATKLHMADKNIRIDMNGSLSNIRVAYRMLEPTSPGQVMKAARRLGISNPDKRIVYPKTASKRDGSFSSSLYKILPKKFGGMAK